MDLKGAETRNYYKLGNELTKNISKDIPVTFKIPHYQRPFKWEEKHIGNLINDYQENMKQNADSAEYFTGAIVSVTSEDYHALIDGQQRFTTMFLANYLRFLLYRAYFELSILKRDHRARSDAEKFEKTCRYLFKTTEGLEKVNFESFIDEAMKDNAAENKVIENYRKSLFISSKTINNKDEYGKDCQRLLREELSSRKLMLQYDRSSFNELICEALSRITVLVSTNTLPELLINFDEEENSQLNIYLNAIHTIFNRFYRIVKDKCNSKPLVCLKLIIDEINIFFENIIFCIVQTGNSDDAYTLFEVLNDRSLTLDDLDIIKNLFYRKYVNFEPQQGRERNKHIDKFLDSMEQVWGDEIFGNEADYFKRLVSYLGVIYLSGSCELVNERGDKLRQTVRKYTNGRTEYNQNNLKNDFYVFKHIKQFLKKVDIKSRKKDQILITSITDSKTSYIKRTILLAYALDMIGIIPSVTNLIIDEISDKDETQINEILNNMLKKQTAIQHFPKIEKFAYYMFNLIISAENHEAPRKIAQDIIKNINMVTPTDTSFTYEANIKNAIKSDTFKKWANNWIFKYKSQKLKLHSLFLLLLSSQLEVNIKNKTSKLVLNRPFSTSLEDACSLTLDHLEPQNVKDEFKNFYFRDEQERERIVNELGNMMPLDRGNNASKSNYPMEACFEHLEKAGLKDHWLVKEIEQILDVHNILYENKKIPNKSFFEIRKKRLIDLMSAILVKDFDSGEVEIRNLSEYIK